MESLETEAIESGEPSDEGGTSGVGTSSKPTMSPAEASEKIRRGELIQNVRIVGLKLKGVFDQPIRFKGVTLVELVIEKATFAEEVSFDFCTLDRPKASRKSDFAKGLNLGGSTLIRAIFRGMRVHGPLRCDNTRYRGKFHVEASRFEGRARFWEAHFLGWVEFKECEFADEADFRSIHVDQGFILTKCRFLANVLFRGATVQKKWQADNTRFEGLLDLSKAKLHDFVYLELIEQGEKQRFAFTNALAEQVLVRTEQLAGRIASEEAGDCHQATHEYAFLKRVFQGLHHYDREDWAFYRFKVNQRRAKVRSWRQPWTKLAQYADWLFLDHGCGYGTNPLRAVCAALIIMLVFAAIYALGIHSLYVENPPFPGKEDDLANRLMIAALTSVSTFTSGFGDIRGAAKGWMNLALIAESLLGTLLWGLFIVAFSRKVIR